MPAPIPQLDIIDRRDGVEFAVKVVPGASRSRVAGLLGAALKLAVAAPPEKGQANAAVTELLAAALGVKRADIEIVAGRSQPHKRVRVRGVAAAAVLALASGNEPPREAVTE